jgi:hypothetical protein
LDACGCVITILIIETHRSPEEPVSVLSAARTQSLVRAVLALLLPALGGCSTESKGGITPAPVMRAMAVAVHDARDAPVASATVFAVRLDVLATVTAAPTDALGIAQFTLGAGRWAVSTRIDGGSTPAQVAGSTGFVTASASGVPDTVLFRLQLATESIATGHCALAGGTDHSGTIVSALEFPALASTDASGAWLLAGLPPGVWTGYATHLGYAPAVFDLVVPAPDDTLEIAPIVLRPGSVPLAMLAREPAQNWK